MLENRVKVKRRQCFSANHSILPHILVSPMLMSVRILYVAHLVVTKVWFKAIPHLCWTFVQNRKKTSHTPIPTITHLLFKKLIFQCFCGLCSATACSYFAVCLHYYFFSKPTSWHLAVDTTDGFELKFLHCQFCGMRKEDRRCVSDIAVADV